MENKKYIETVGRRKTATARVRITEAPKTTYLVNERELAAYFPTPELQRVATAAFAEVADSANKATAKFKVTARISGGGISAQAAALRHGIARALIIHDLEFRPKLKKAGFLKRDPRVKERRKFGLKKARKAPQWSKR
jgi:small subunit ribosomal protein S9